MVRCEEESQKPYHVDDVLDEFSIFGRYHLQVMILAFIAFSSNTAYSTNYVFAASSVGYRCKDPHDNITQFGVWGNDTICAQWEYDDPDSFVAEFGLACQEWKRSLVGTAHSVGNMVGLLIVGPLSDRFGRKTAVVMTGVMGGVFGLARSFSTWYWFYIAMEFLEAVFGDIASPMYVLEMEMTSARKKIRFNMYCALGYCSGGVILAIIAWLVPYWRTYLQVTYAPALLFFFYQYLLDESPRWLLTRDKKEKAITILQKASKKNNINLDQNTLDNLTWDVSKEVKFWDLLTNTFKSPVLRLRFFACLVWWTTSTFTHYGMVINSVILQGNKYMNYAVTALTKIPSIILNKYVLSRFNRKLPLMISFFIGGLLCILQPLTPVDLPWLSVSFYMLGKLVGAMYFGITYVYTLELFPTYTRNSMHALCSAIGRIGSIMAPQTPLLLPIWSGLPTMIFGLSAVVAGLTTLLVPDITDEVLPDTMKEAEALGRSKVVKTEEDQIINLINRK